MQSDIKYARTGDVHIAYRVFGEGPRDLVLIPGTLSHVELYWEFPVNQYLLKRLTSFARVIVFDKRGQGLSDRIGEQTVEERIGDVRAVMDAAGSPRATIFGWSEGGPMSLMFSATYPERTSALVLCGSFACVTAEPWAVSQERWDQFLHQIEMHWGEGVLVPINAPSRRDEEAFVQWFGRLERASASPGAILALMRANYGIDVRHVLPVIQAPTLILHRVGDRTVPVEAGRYLAQHIRGARYPVCRVAGRRSSSPSLRSADAGSADRRDRRVRHRRAIWSRSGSRARHRDVHGHRELDRAGGGCR
jgi:pimeloyl-ACP methyl ester carboxylesterase